MRPARYALCREMTPRAEVGWQFAGRWWHLGARREPLLAETVSQTALGLPGEGRQPLQAGRVGPLADMPYGDWMLDTRGTR